MLRVQFRERDVILTRALRAHVDRSLGLALGRFGERIGPVTVRFSTDAGDQRCEIDVGLRPRKVRGVGVHADLFAAIDHASERLSNAVGRALERERELDDRVPPAPPPAAPRPKAAVGTAPRSRRAPEK